MQKHGEQIAQTQEGGLNMLNLRVEEKDAAYLMGLLQATRNRTQEQLDEGRSVAPELLRESIDNIDRLLDEINEQFYRKARDLD
tara:strand:- start:97 stop:348 length:252 start_codon:yes stop_codon:yes gene_type:complete